MKKIPFSFEYAPGATPLDPNEINGLIPEYISTQSELNELEQQNILDAQVWLTGKNKKTVLTDTFARELHYKMFKNVWNWAGKYRQSDKSIGVSWPNVPTELSKLLSDTDYWIQNNTYSPDEMGARFHHRLVLIHAFPNGNGRHARLLTDTLLASCGKPAFSWGANSFVGSKIESSGDIRSEYISALREADEKKIQRLIKFVKS